MTYRMYKCNCFFYCVCDGNDIILTIVGFTDIFASSQSLYYLLCCGCCDIILYSMGCTSIWTFLWAW